MVLFRSIFISRNSIEIPLLEDYCKINSIQLVAQSLVQFEAVAAQSTFCAEIIFFSSIRAAEFYLADHIIESRTEIATIGEKTAEKLRKLGLAVHFIGSTAGDPDKVASEFSHWSKGRKVLIPCSDWSSRSIASAFPADQVEELIVYRAITFPKQILPCEVYIFSSPSNLEAFLEMNRIPSAAQIVAWGKTTEKALIQNGYSATWVLNTSSEEEVIQIFEKKNR